MYNIKAPLHEQISEKQSGLEYKVHLNSCLHDYITVLLYEENYNMCKTPTAR